jgi:hypothetical protein
MPYKQPAPKTLEKYGMTAEEHLQLWRDQGEACGVCGEDAHDRYVTDHQHVAGWAKMEPEDRKRFVRGIVGNAENHYLLPRYMNATRAALVHAYLLRYERRRDA